MSNRSRLAVEQMSDSQLFERALSVVANCRHTAGCSIHEREARLDELVLVLRHLRDRGQQIQLDYGSVSR